MTAMNHKAEILKLLTATYEVLGQSTTPAALLLIADDLAPYGLAAVAQALIRCRREVSGRLTPAEIIKRIQAVDGRPEPNEAWAIALQGQDERDTVVLNNDIAQAMSCCRDILDAGDEVGARMAFIEAYKRIVNQAREQNEPVTWYPSLGFDKAKREAPILKAIERGKLNREHVAAALPHIVDREPEMSFDRLLAGESAKANPEKAKAILGDLKSMFNGVKQ